MNFKLMKKPIIVSVLFYALYIPFGNGFLKQNKAISKENIKEKIISKKEDLINFSNLERLLIENNDELKIIKSRIEQSKSILKSKKAAWSPRLNLVSNQLPKYTTSDTRDNFSENTTSPFGTTQSLSSMDLSSPGSSVGWGAPLPSTTRVSRPTSRWPCPIPSRSMANLQARFATTWASMNASIPSGCSPSSFHNGSARCL